MKKKTRGTTPKSKKPKATTMMLPKMPKQIKTTLSKITKPIEKLGEKFISKTIFGELIIAILFVAIVVLIICIVLACYPSGQETLINIGKG